LRRVPVIANLQQSLAIIDVTTNDGVAQ